MNQKVDLRETQFQDYQAIAALEASQGLSAKPFSEWRRLWAGNPSYEELGPRWPIGWVLEDAGRVVGSFGNIPLQYVFRGRKLRVATGRGWVVEPDYRGYAPLLMDEHFNQEGVDLWLTNTVNGNAADALNTFGCSRVPLGDWSRAAFAVTEYRGFAQSALRIKQVAGAAILGFPAGWALSLKDRLQARRIPKTDIDVTLARDFDRRFDTFWEVLSQRSTALLGVRTLQALKWHFASSIEQGKLWVLTASRNGNIDAYAVFQRRDEPQYGLTRMRMVDFQAWEWYDQYCAALMKRAYQECQSQGIQVLEQVGCGLERTRIFDKCAPYRRDLPEWSFYYQAQDQELAQQLKVPDAWAPSSYDGDASL